MKRSFKTWIILATVVTFILFTGQAFAKDTTIKVSLWDKGPMSMNMLGNGPQMGMMMGNTRGNMPMAPMGITVSTHKVKAGKVTFSVTNTSTALVHEMIVAPVKDEKAALPYDKATLKVDEEAAGHLGEVSELAPGKSGTLAIDLKPGKYILYCNIPGHYVLGMWTLITVN